MNTNDIPHHRKWQLFWQQKRAIIGVSIFIIIFVLSMCANIISNSRPLLLIRTSETNIGNQIYFPILFNYPPQNFDMPDAFFVNFKALVSADQAAGKKTIAVFPPNPWNAEEQDSEILLPPSKTHYLGTDNLGRDVLARLLYGTRISLAFALLLWLLTYSVGILLGAMQGYFFGKFDFILERLKELSAIMPTLTLIILVTAITKQQSFWLILALVTIFGWMGIASQIRASVFSIRTQEYCDAAIALGGRHSRIMFKHILPNVLAPVITLTPFAIESGISLLAALDYLGFGLPPPTPSIGELMAQGRDNIQNAPWLLVSPIITILLILVAISLIGQALRDAFDPKIG